MKILSPVFNHNSAIPSLYTCDGENINPPLMFEDVPTEAQSLVLISDDPDAPAGTWVHWTVWNISPSTKDIKENACPKEAVEGITSFGTTGYGGPCPPSGEHRYFFKLYALDTILDLGPETDKERLEESIQGHVIGQCEIIGLYSRQ